MQLFVENKCNFLTFLLQQKLALVIIFGCWSIHNTFSLSQQHNRLNMQANSHHKSNWRTAKQIHGQQVSLFTDLPCSLHIGLISKQKQN